MAAQPTARRDALVDIERRMQQRWEQERPYDADAPASNAELAHYEAGKFFITFPYPYMNGRLHLGHGFSLSKSEFAARFWRLKGRNVLWPFGLHVTGTPIAACAQKIANEIRQYGCPPVFPESALEAKKQAAAAAQTTEVGGPVKHTGRRGKVGPAIPQWQIMQGMGLVDSEIAAFADARYWLNYFPPRAIDDLKRMGCHIDYRRSFITTHYNPYYNSFVQWQFRKLRAQGKLGFGKRYCVYSPVDGQPCADHDRASGEGVGPQEYTCVKLRVKSPLQHPALQPHADLIGSKPVILPAATLRPETVVGQTNVWLSPDITYGAFEIQFATGEPEIHILCARAARNMAFQDIKVNGQAWHSPEPLFEVSGDQLIGIAVESPGCPYDTIYALPMGTISDTKGTGVVMSVPSDSPDDYINFVQLVKKPDYRAKLGLKDEWVVPFAMVPIIDIPGHELGNNAAQIACEKLKVNGPKDTALLEEAKKMVYQAGFYQGVMSRGPFAGEKVAIAKVKMTQLMIAEGNAFKYYEPAKPVTSRSADDCVVALCDQWFIEYGKEEWRVAVEEHLKGMETYFSGIRNGFEETLKWLADWPCSRSFGLGTTLPFEDAHGAIIDSLSDSTIYMSYYMAAKYIHAAADGSLNLDGTKPNKYGLKPEMFDNAMWDYILLGKGTAEEQVARTNIAHDVAVGMRREFEYFYPVDLRVSGKDLIQNHLTMFLYNHAAIWENDPSKWPRSIYCNGHVLVNGDKMSKSKGNFVVLETAIQDYSADGTRLALADAGDSLDDANFVTESAKNFVLKLSAWIESSKEKTSALGTMRKGPLNLFDRIFENSINRIIETGDKLYRQMQFRAVLNTVFFEWASEESLYRQWCGDSGPHADVMRRYVETLTLLMMPLAPHTAEYLWTEVLQHPESIMRARFPAMSAPVDLSLEMATATITNVVSEIRQQLTKASKKKGAATPTDVHVFGATSYHPWQQQSLVLLKTVWEEHRGEFPKDLAKVVRERKEPWMTPKDTPEIMAFIAFARDLTTKFGPLALSTTPLTDDLAVLTASHAFLQEAAGVTVTIKRIEDSDNAAHRSKARPGEPTVVVVAAAAPAAATAAAAA